MALAKASETAPPSPGGMVDRARLESDPCRIYHGSGRRVRRHGVENGNLSSSPGGRFGHAAVAAVEVAPPQAVSGYWGRTFAAATGAAAAAGHPTGRRTRHRVQRGASLPRRRALPPGRRHAICHRAGARWTQHGAGSHPRRAVRRRVARRDVSTGAATPSCSSLPPITCCAASGRSRTR